MSDEWEMIWGIVGIIAIGIFAIFGIVVIFEPTTEVCTQSQLVVMHDNTATSGTFFLGSGSLDGGANYLFYEKNNDGSTVLTSVGTYSGEGYEEYRPKVFQEDRTDGIVIKCREKGVWTGLYDTRIRYEFHIPNDSIITGYKLDAQ